MVLICKSKSFWHSASLRYGWQVSKLGSGSGSKFDIQHNRSCKKGSFVTIRHNDLRDYRKDATTPKSSRNLSRKVEKTLAIEPQIDLMKQDLTFGHVVFGKEDGKHFLI